MTFIISTPAAKEAVISILPHQLMVNKWLTQRVVPADIRKIVSLAWGSGIEKGNVILLVKYGRRSPSQFPPICSGEWLISLVFYNSFNDITNWLKAVKHFAFTKPQKALVLGMMKPFYIHWANKIYECLKKERYPTRKIFRHLPDKTTHVELAQKLSLGCSLAIYVGHGRSRGWSGYRGFRWKHVAMFDQKKPIGTMISLSCSSLKRDKNSSVSMGLQWIMEGRCCAFIGACDSVKIKPLIAITTIILECLSLKVISTVNILLMEVNKRIIAMNDPDIISTWSKFRLIGNPFLPLQAE